MPSPLTCRRRPRPCRQSAPAAPPRAAPEAQPRRGDSIAATTSRRSRPCSPTRCKTGADKLALQMQAQRTRQPVRDRHRPRRAASSSQGYGVFFDVDVPMMKQSVLWSARQLQQQDTRDAARELRSRRQPADGAATRDWRDPAELRQLQARRGTAADARASRRAARRRWPQPDRAAAATRRRGDRAAPAPPAPAPDPRDPNELYTEAVKTSLIDAMLKYSVGAEARRRRVADGRRPRRARARPPRAARRRVDHRDPDQGQRPDRLPRQQAHPRRSAEEGGSQGIERGSESR